MKYYWTIENRTTTDTCNNVPESPRDAVKKKKTDVCILEGAHLHEIHEWAKSVSGDKNPEGSWKVVLMAERCDRAFWGTPNQ